MHLTPEQRAAAQSREDFTIVEAGPGSGKTVVLAARIAHLIRDRGAKPERILALTFTRTACASIRGKVEDAVGPAMASRVNIHTFHGFAYSIVRAAHPELTVASEIEAEAALRSLYKGPTRRPQVTPIKKLRDGIMAIEGLGCMSNDERVESTIEDITLLRNRLWDAGLIPTWALVDGAHLCPGGVPQFNHVLVDELQDCTENEWSLANRASNTYDFFAVGDPRQAIMGWRGARDWDYETTHRLTRTFRFGRRIAAIANLTASSFGGASIAGGDAPDEFVVGSLDRVLLETGSRAVLCRTHRECAAVAYELGNQAVHVQRKTDDALDCDADRYETIERDGRIAVTTIHAAKGREWDVVALARPAKAPDTDEERRVAYVAATRARRLLIAETERSNWDESTEELEHVN